MGLGRIWPGKFETNSQGQFSPSDRNLHSMLAILEESSFLRKRALIMMSTLWL
jgi:hypothetical protein